MEPDSVALLSLAREGDGGALDRLISIHRDWLWGYVRRHMGNDLRAFEASEDVVQDVLRKLIQRGPSFVPRNDDEFRRLVATIVLNRLRDRHDWIHAERRGKNREEGLEAQPRTHVGIAAKSQDSPSRAAARNEEQALVELSMQLVDPDDAHIIRLRNWDNLSFEEIGEQLSIESDAARMRFHRVVRRLGKIMRKLDEGDLEDLGSDMIS